MAEARSKRMQTVLWLAKRKEQQAGEIFQQFQKRLAAEQQQLEQLADYSRDLAQTMRGMKIATGPQLLQQRAFFQRLNDAQAGQQQKLDQMRREFERLRQDWLKMLHRRNAISDLIDRLKQEENEAIEKFLQRELDEMAAKASHNRD